MPGALTEITEIATALGMLAPDLTTALASKPDRLGNVSEDVWARISAAFDAGNHASTFVAAFENGVTFLRSEDGLRSRAPRLVEWKGPHQAPVDPVTPTDLRVDHVYQISCKYLSKILLNCGPARLFDRLLVGDRRGNENWFAACAADAYDTFYGAVVDHVGSGLPSRAADLGAGHRTLLKEVLAQRTLPAPLQPAWRNLCAEVSEASTARWRRQLTDRRAELRVLWRLLRIGDASYFVLGSSRTSTMQLRVVSNWDWTQAFVLKSFSVWARRSGQPEVGWRAMVESRSGATEWEILGHVEVRWSHGRFQGAPEAKVYLDTPFHLVPGYLPLSE